MALTKALKRKSLRRHRRFTRRQRVNKPQRLNKYRGLNKNKLGRKTRRKNYKGQRKTTRKMRGGEGVKEAISDYEKKHQPYIIILKTCKKACDALQPFIQAVYYILYMKKNNITSDTDDADTVATTKNSETDIFTIADGMVQYIIKKYLFPEGQSFVGEEELNPDAYNIYEHGKRKINETNIPKHLFEKIDTAIETIKQLRENNFNNEYVKNKLDELAVFLDPIDGTAEFSHTDKRNIEKDAVDIKTYPWPPEGKGDQATICIGFAKKEEPYNAVAGIVYRPVRMSIPLWNGEDEFPPDANPTPTQSHNGVELVTRPGLMKNTYALGYADGDDKFCDITHLDIEKEKPEAIGDKIRYIISNGGVPPSLVELVKDDIVIKSGGAGNKILLLLENRGDVYLSDRGVSHWDTCAGEAILEAHGGRLCKLTDFINGEEANITGRYHYKAFVDPLIGKNPDLNDAATPTDFNRIWKTDEEKEQYKKNKKDADMKALLKAQHINPYSNLCGLFAIKDRTNIDLINKVFNKIKETKPKFNYD